jgi:hypothetical protein
MTYQERLFRQQVGFCCEPTTWMMIASLAIAAGSAAYQIDAQNKAQDAQEEYQKDLVESSNKAAYEQQVALRNQEAQNSEASARENERARLASQSAQATANVALGEAGISGNTADALLSEYNMNLGQYREALTRQDQLSKTGTEDQIRASLMGTRFQNLSINQKTVGANYGAAGLDFAGSALGSYRAYNPDAFQKPKKTTTTPTKK